MPDALSAERAPAEPAADPQPLAAPVAGRLAMVALGYIPLLHVIVTATGLVVSANKFGPFVGFVVALAIVYLLPPLASAFARPKSLLAAEHYTFGSNGFLRWWYISQWQVVFNRLPALEEALRLVPTLYSNWLRLWGAKIGGLVYWSPGVQVFDRSYLRIGSRVVIGAQTKICPHLVMKDANGNHELILSPVVIGDDALVGASTLLPAGVRIAAHEQTPGGRPIAPFTSFANGGRSRSARFNTETHGD